MCQSEVTYLKLIKVDGLYALGPLDEMLKNFEIRALVILVVDHLSC